MDRPRGDAGATIWSGAVAEREEKRGLTNNKTTTTYLGKTSAFRE